MQVRKFFWLFGMMLLAGFLVACGSQKKQAAQKPQAPAEKSLDVTPDMLALEIDPNCGMDLHQHAIKDTAIYQGRLYGFCSEGCKEAFKRDPEAKLAAIEKKMGKP